MHSPRNILRLPAICRGNETPASNCKTTRGGADAGAVVVADDADEETDVEADDDDDDDSDSDNDKLLEVVGPVDLMRKGEFWEFFAKEVW